jgi:ankyrin repeat protein
MGREKCERSQRTVGAIFGKQAVMSVVLALISLAQEMPQKDKVPVTMKYDRIVSQGFPAREVSATITREDVKALESKGYVELGSVSISYPTTGGREKKAPGSVEEMLLKEATARSGDVVRIETANVPSMIPSGSYTQGGCNHRESKHHIQCDTGNHGYVRCQPVSDGAGPCDGWEQVPVLVPGLTTTGSVWRHDPKLAADIAAAADAAQKFVREVEEAEAAESVFRSLHESLSKGQDAEVELLLAHGADINARDIGGRTQLHYAAEEGRVNVAELLLAHGADVNAKDNEGKTPLRKAAESGKKELAVLLLANGADVNARDNIGLTPLYRPFSKDESELLLAHGADVNAKDNEGKTPLHHAVSDDPKDKTLEGIVKEITGWDLAQIEVLLAHGADVNARDNNGRTPLSYAKIGAIAKLLRQHGGHK